MAVSGATGVPLKKEFLVTFCALVLVAALAALDQATDPHFSFFVFYLAPVALAAWSAGIWGGILVAGASFLMWVMDDVRSSPSSIGLFVPYWDLFTRLVFCFGFIALLASFKRLLMKTDRQQQALRAHNNRLEDLVSERTAVLKIAQAQLIQAERMSAMGQLSAGIAHEIQAPLADVVGNLAALSDAQRKIGAFLKKEVPAAARFEAMEMFQGSQDILDEAVHRAGKIASLVKDLGSFTHPARSDLRPGNIHDCIQSALDTVHGELRLKVEVVKEYGDIPPLSFNAPQMAQVFVNLFTNAAQAMGHGGRLIIRTRGQEDHVCIEVGDNGAGIPEDVLPRIFDPFFTTKPVGEGTGLGLSIVQGILAAHRGAISVRSEPGAGTSFLITLPCLEFVPANGLSASASPPVAREFVTFASFLFFVPFFL